MPLQTFKVTKEVLKKAADALQEKDNVRLSNNCAISMAMRPKYPNVGTGFYIFPNESFNLSIPTPIELLAYMNSFDKGDYAARITLPEFEFTLDIPEELYNA